MGTEPWIEPRRETKRQTQETGRQHQRVDWSWMEYLPISSYLSRSNTNGISTDITIDNKKLETAHSFKYLGAIVSDEGSKPEVLSRIAQTTAAVTKLKVIWNDKNIAISSKVRLMRSLAMSIFFYACETWTITADIERRIQAMEMRCFRKLLGISYTDHITNEEVKVRIGNAIGPYEDLLTTVKRRKLKWYGHVTRSSGLAKTILQWTVQGGRRRGRQRKRWEDVKEWTGLPWNITLRKAENREEWRKLVVKSTVVPQRSARLWDREREKRSLADRWGTTVDFTASFLHSSRFSAFHSIIFYSRPVQQPDTKGTTSIQSPLHPSHKQSVDWTLVCCSWGEPLTTGPMRRYSYGLGYVQSSGLAKTILQGIVQEGRQRGRQRKQEDSIKEWTGLEWNIILRKAEHREECRKLVVKSTVVPHRSARLRDR